MSSNAHDTVPENIPPFLPSQPDTNVQEMVRKEPMQVPERYRWSGEEMQEVAEISYLSSEIPVIDLSLLLEEKEDELKKLDLACKEWGFFQVVNHGVKKEVLQKMKDAAANFFELPFEEKNKYVGYGLRFPVSEEQKLDWSDAVMLRVYPPRELELWPFNKIIQAYSTEIRKVGEKLLCSLSLINGMEKDALLGLHKFMGQGLRVNYYPACSRPDQVLGISPHSDISSITILMQDNDLTGLQIRHNEGWVPVKPIPNALVVNVGDVIEIWSNGKYKSIEHRAVTNEKKTRISFATFLMPREDVEIEPLSHMVDSQRPLKLYKKVKYGDYLGHSLKRKLEGKAHIQTAKIET